MLVDLRVVCRISRRADKAERGVVDGEGCASQTAAGACGLGLCGERPAGQAPLGRAEMGDQIVHYWSKVIFCWVPVIVAFEPKIVVLAVRS